MGKRKRKTNSKEEKKRKKEYVVGLETKERRRHEDEPEVHPSKRRAGVSLCRDRCEDAYEES